MARLVAVVGSAIALREFFLQLQRYGKLVASNLGERALEKCRNLGDFESGGFKYMELLFFVIVFQCFSNVLGHTGDDWLR